MNFFKNLWKRIYFPFDTRFGFIMIIIFLIMPFIIGSSIKAILWNESIYINSFGGAIHTYFLGLFIILSISAIVILFIMIMYFCSKCLEYLQCIRKRKSQSLDNDPDELEIPLYD